MADLAGEKPAYFGFVGEINDDGATRIATAMNAAVNDGRDVVHMAFSSLGGYIAQGIYLYNHIRAMPLRVVAYNTGSVSSIAVSVFVAAEDRFCSANAMFMIHPSAFPNLTGMTWERLDSAQTAALADDQRTEAILRERTRLTDDLLNAKRFRDVHITPQAAVSHGLVQGIAEFKVPLGFQIHQI